MSLLVDTLDMEILVHRDAGALAYLRSSPYSKNLLVAPVALSDDEPPITLEASLRVAHPGQCRLTPLYPSQHARAANPGIAALQPLPVVLPGGAQASS